MWHDYSQNIYEPEIFISRVGLKFHGGQRAYGSRQVT